MKRGPVVSVVSILAIALGGFALRMARLDVRPMHCDEANQAARAGLLLETGVYRYDPREHHGPTLYWLTLPSLRLRGAKDFAQTKEVDYRIVPVLFGVGLIVLLVLAADGLGGGAAAIAALLTALSPAMVFYSRYYIQETLLVFFTFATIACAWRYVRSRSAGWAIAAGVCVGLMHATKETWVLAAAAMVLGLAAAMVWSRWRDGTMPAVGPVLRPGPIAAGVLAACLVAGALYSSLGTHWRGPIDSVLAYQTYFRRGGEGGIHAHPPLYYLELLFAYRPTRGMFWSEGLIAGLGLIGCLVALRRAPPSLRQRAAVEGIGRGEDQPKPPDPNPSPEGEGRDRNSFSPGFARFLVFYTLLLTLFYSAIAYKTPWCMLSFLDGMILLAGLGAWATGCWLPGVPAKIAGCLVLAAAGAQLGWQSYVLNFRLYADPRNPYVYAHTSSDILNLAAQMERLAAVSPDGHAMTTHVVTPENYWPLPWYLRHFQRDHVGYWQDVAAWVADTRRLPPPSVIILTPDVQAQVDAHLRAAYNQQMIYGLQPGVLLSVYVREDLWEAFRSARGSSPRGTGG